MPQNSFKFYKVTKSVRFNQDTVLQFEKFNFNISQKINQVLKLRTEVLFFYTTCDFESTLPKKSDARFNGWENILPDGKKRVGSLPKKSYKQGKLHYRKCQVSKVSASSL